jgi:CMP-N,N'-diacetyllegionaminic acid synthase
MTYKNKSILAIVPARSGSKGIPEKNIAILNGIPLLGHAGIFLSQLDFVDYTLLSTDSASFAKVGHSFGLNTPFLRPQSLSGDASLSIDVWRHGWIEAERITGTIYDICIFLEPTSPFRKPEDIYKALELLTSVEIDSVVSVSKTPAHSTPEKTMRIDSMGFLSQYVKSGVDFSIRQKIPSYYHRNGICYAAKRTAIIDEMQIIGAKTCALVIDRNVVNIDEPIDMLWAEFLMANSKK